MFVCLNFIITNVTNMLKKDMYRLLDIYQENTKHIQHFFYVAIISYLMLLKYFVTENFLSILSNLFVILNVIINITISFVFISLVIYFMFIKFKKEEDQSSPTNKSVTFSDLNPLCEEKDTGFSLEEQINSSLGKDSFKAPEIVNFIGDVFNRLNFKFNDSVDKLEDEDEDLLLYRKLQKEKNKYFRNQIANNALDKECTDLVRSKSLDNDEQDNTNFN